MSIFSTFSKKAPNRVFISIVLGAVAGIGYSILIPLVLIAISPADATLDNTKEELATVLSFEVANYKIAAVYAIACLIILIMRTASEILLVRVSNDLARDLRTKFYDKISQAPLAEIEKIGSSRFIASINIDVPRIITGGRAIPSVLVNSITLCGMLCFLAYLNPDVFKLVLIAILVGASLYQIPMIVGRNLLGRSRELKDNLQEATKGLIYGAKELKLDSEKRKQYFDNVLLAYEDEIVSQDKKAETMLRGSTSFGDLISFLVIGSVSFIFVNYYAIGTEELIAVVMILLYISSPVSMLLGVIPQLAMASISYRKLNGLLKHISTEDIEEYKERAPKWESLTFQNVEYRYPSREGDVGFHVGPINLEIRKGEITFVIGANGSGKSTLSKLLTLHYAPDSGAIYFDDKLLSSKSLASYRQDVGAIYSDYYLFDRLLIDLDADTEKQAKDYLHRLQLSHKVQIKDGKFSTLSLSDGQRKRLALLVSFLDDKELYLFDEWAADQDPIFKNIFYNQILSDLRNRNKAVIVISHDDRYFHIADRILIMELGKLRTEKKVTGRYFEGLAMS